MLSKKAKYGLKALIYLAKESEERPLPVSQIAESQKISVKFLEAILNDLRTGGILKSKKGKMGGYQLNVKASEIKMSDIMRLLDGPIALLPCVSLNFYDTCEECLDENNCSIRKVALQVRDATLEILGAATLEELVKNEK